MNRKPKTYRTVLSIAGSDSIGGAGVQADVKTCCALGVYAMTALTAITAQNTRGVSSFASVSGELLGAQIDAVFRDVRPDAVKIGMIPDVASARVIAAKLLEYDAANVVLDPVMVATSGDALCSESTLDVMRASLMPMAEVITPNLPEAAAILGCGVDDIRDMRQAAAQLLAVSGAKAVYLKGGHSTAVDGCIADVLAKLGANGPDEVEIHVFRNRIVDTQNTHGTGCSLSSAIACGLAYGKGLVAACDDACQWLHGAIEAGKDYQFGHGHGPVNHLYGL